MTTAERTNLETTFLRHLRQSIATKGYQPSIREYCKLMNIKSTKTVADIIERLAAKGILEPSDKQSRAIKIKNLASFMSMELDVV